jgi:3-isopropylmalate/(R)-2-methylmalate dehydratase small subunit
MTQPRKVDVVKGRAVAVRGNDIDTDRIIPARFLIAITFDGLGDHLFEDDRREAKAHGKVHPIDVPAHAGAGVLLANGNFGCGSSREHAPQAIMRWGVSAVVAESFAEIFFGNSMMLGMPCVCVSHDDAERLMAVSEAHPETEFVVDLEASRITAGHLSVPLTMPEAARKSLLSGGWDGTGQLLDRYEEVERAVARVPYLSGWATR